MAGAIELHERVALAAGVGKLREARVEGKLDWPTEESEGEDA